MKNRLKRVGKLLAIATFLLSAMSPLAANPIAPQDWDSYLQQRFGALNQMSINGASRRINGPQKPVNMTILLLQARGHWDELSTTTRNLVSPWLLRPTTTDVAGNLIGDGVALALDPAILTTVDTAHFRLHYVSATTYPDNIHRASDSYANSVATVLEEVYGIQHATLGYAAVPSDAAMADNGGNGLYDVYLGDLGAIMLYGYVTFDAVHTDDTTRPRGSASYMVLDNDFAPSQYGYANSLDPLQVTCAHEYFHAVQMGYDWQEQPAFMESSSTWMEDQAYPAIHDNYQYIGEPYTDTNNNGYYDKGEPFTDHDGNGQLDSGSVDYPELPLDSFGVIGFEQYGRFLWVRFLEEHYDVNIVREIWEEAATLDSSIFNDTTFLAVDNVLIRRGSTLAQAYQTYAEWGYDTSQFSDGMNYPRVWIDGVFDAAVSFSSAISPSLSWLASYGYPVQMKLSTVYMQINHPSGEYSFSSTGGVPAVTMLVDDGSGTLQAQRLVLSAGRGSWIPPAGVVKAVAVISNSSAQLNGMSWSFVSGSNVANVTVPPSRGGGGAVSFISLWMLMLGGLLPLYRRRIAAVAKE